MIIGNINTEDFSAKKLYEKLIERREKYLDRARNSSKVTIAQLFPEQGKEDGDDYANPYQSLGSRGVNNLANKIILTLFPPNSAFFKMGLNPADAKLSGKSQGDIEDAMYTVENSVIADMEESALRPKLIHLMKQLIVGGSSLLYIPPEGSPEVHKLDTFGINRDKKGNILQLVLKEQVNYLELAEDVKGSLKDLEAAVIKGDKPLDLYTVIITNGNDTFSTWQIIKDVIVDGSTGMWTKETLPYLFVPFIDTGENYGRSYTEDFYGDIISYEGLRKSILEASAEAARIVYMVKPNATTSAKALQGANSGDVIVGNIDDVGTLQADKTLDLQVTQQESEVLRMDLSSIFLLDSTVRRNAERVNKQFATVALYKLL